MREEFIEMGFITTLFNPLMFRQRPEIGFEIFTDVLLTRAVFGKKFLNQIHHGRYL
jgi:hypothetical protein